MLIAKDASRVALQQFKRSAFGRRSVRLAPKSTAAFGCASSDQQAEEVHVEKSTFSNTISFSSPESDFSTSHLLIKSQYTDLDYAHKEETMNESQENNSQANWSGAFSFSSPESDFTSGSSLESLHMNSNQATKEARDTFFQNLDNKSQTQADLAYSLSFSSAESDFCNPEFTEMLNDRMKKQLDNASALAELTNHDGANQLSSMVDRHEVSIPPMQKKATQYDSNDAEYLELRAHAKLLSHEDPLPRTMEEAQIENDDRAIVITEATIPFNIVRVNSAWEHLCGYTNEECIGNTLRCIQGAETNQAAVTALMSQLLRGEEAATVLVNYRKDGSKFLNRLRVGILKDDQSSVTHFVGILKEVEEMADKFDNGSRILA
mmetsp:Transcript_13489/g.17042  ORF Transcript_13489/g.17042 Transcript_13489/m.17042 type:complete len:377 (-) Transcript_13489:119-1249(-)|eukprot:CAMPEP_0203676992 /NCGR_PEP_ID=MMETSP0090-20130426/26755_1 /ASSEMBLY_ACC=CAM_ASM_001088 /TAXON_ID=426623 /ORGANISM="Chaetoceros affinis, Strain CCMP159" /LENGTH=376 /DNA_ID=CAMNT_0050543753 /DNA_START=65 /DNA_END=1195 /DNA_ORIENTATION=-